MATATNLSDKALSVFAFAAYHQLESGQRVSSVVRRDGAGHQADEGGVTELQERGLIETTETSLDFTAEGERVLAGIVEAMRGAGA